MELRMSRTFGDLVGLLADAEGGGAGTLKLELLLVWRSTRRLPSAGTGRVKMLHDWGQQSGGQEGTLERGGKKVNGQLVNECRGNKSTERRTKKLRAN